ncbi:Ribonucleoside-diphosphate reductase small subunit [uncultured virus]|nr:Ribonucleoside-diphosphate reductase small subunit [uncultured virus]
MIFSLKMTEKILTPNAKRFVLKPIQYPEVFQVGKLAEASVWGADEIDLSTDLVDWNYKLNEDEKHFIKWVLAFFASADGIVIENLVLNLCGKVQIPEARFTYGFQIAIENVHSETYSMLIEELISDQAEQTMLFESLETIESIKKKREWGQKYTSSGSFAMNLVGSAIFEGLFFSAAFCSIFWLKKRGLMPGLTFSNELISRDEGLHVDFAGLLYSMLEFTRLSDDEFLRAMKDAVECEKSFVRDALPVRLIGINSVDMCQYVEFVADRLCVLLGYKKIYFATNPFDWMNLISIDGKTNFFERRVGEYQKANVMAGMTKQTNGFQQDEDF